MTSFILLKDIHGDELLINVDEIVAVNKFPVTKEIIEPGGTTTRSITSQAKIYLKSKIEYSVLEPYDQVTAKIVSAKCKIF